MSVWSSKEPAARAIDAEHVGALNAVTQIWEEGVRLPPPGVSIDVATATSWTEFTRLCLSNVALMGSDGEIGPGEIELYLSKPQVHNLICALQQALASHPGGSS